MHLVVFLKPTGAGEEGTLRVYIWDCAAGLGTLNSKNPNLSDVAQERRILQEVASSICKSIQGTT